MSSTKVDKDTGLRCDQRVRLLVAKSRKQYPEEIRRIKYYDSEKGLPLVFLTNELDIPALDVAAIYRERWQIEVFFKWVKQNLEVKKPWGHSRNAIKIQLWVAIITYLMVAMLKKTIKKQILHLRNDTDIEYFDI